MLIAKGNCKFGLKCANAHILPDDRPVNSGAYKRSGSMDGRHLPTSEDGDENFEFEEDYLPETLKDLMTPQEKDRRGFQNTKEGRPIDSGTGVSENETPSKFGSSYYDYDIRWSHLVQLHGQQKEEKEERAAISRASAFGYVGSSPRNPTPRSDKSLIPRPVTRPSYADIGSDFVPRQSSLSITSQQRQRTLPSLAESSGSKSGLPLTSRISSSPGSGPGRSNLVGDRQESRGSVSISRSGRFTPPFDEEQIAFSMEAIDEDEKRAESDKAVVASRMAIGKAWVPIITQNRKRNENRATESEKGEGGRNFRPETSLFGSLSPSTASPGKGTAGKYPTHEDTSKPENREFNGEGVRIVEENGWGRPVVFLPSANRKQLTAAARAGVKNMYLENEEAHSSRLEAEGEAGMSERRSSCSSSYADPLNEHNDPEGDSRPTSWESEDEESAELQALKRKASRPENPLGCGDTDSGLRDTISMGDVSGFSESQLPPSIQNDTGPPSQNSSMTDSTLSEDVTDWDEDSDVESCEHQLHPSSRTHLTGSPRCQSSLFQFTLEPVKKRMLDRLMEEFWIIFNQRWPAGAKQCSPASNNVTTSSSGSTLQTGARSGANISGNREGSYRDEQNHDGNPDKGLGGNGKQPESPSHENQTAPGFACPYRKRDSRKYCVRDWRSCALGPHKTVARVK